MSDEELIAAHTCPICKVKRSGVVDPRRSLVEHLRRMSKTDPAHKMWKTQNWSKFYPHGGNRTETEITAEHVVTSIKNAFGEDWAARVSITA